MHTKTLFSLLALLISLNFSSAYAADALNGSQWTLVNLHSQAALSDTLVTLNFEDGKVTGSDGCNRYRGTFTAKAGKLSFGKNLASTMMMCPETISKQASVYIKALLSTTHYKIDKKSLLLMSAKGKLLATFAKQDTSLSGKSWHVTNINNGKQAVVGLLPNTEITINFGTDGTVNGWAGCNKFTARYEVNDKAIKINNIEAEHNACSNPNNAEQEVQFLRALATAAVIQYDGRLLTLRTAEDAMAVVMTAAP